MAEPATSLKRIRTKKNRRLWRPQAPQFWKGPRIPGQAARDWKQDAYGTYTQLYSRGVRDQWTFRKTPLL